MGTEVAIDFLLHIYRQRHAVTRVSAKFTSGENPVEIGFALAVLAVRLEEPWVACHILAVQSMMLLSLYLLLGFG